MSRWTPRLTTLRIFSADLALVWVVGPGPGDVSIGEENAENANHIEKFDRAIHDDFVLGNDMTQDISFTIELPDTVLTDTLNDRAHDVFKKNAGSKWEFAASVSPTVWAFIVELTFDNGNGTISKKTCPKVRGGGAFSEAAEGSTFNFSGTNHGPIVES